jgi:hypothetical protein
VVVCCKTMLVAKRCLQVEGVDFSETFASVAKLNTIIVILILGAVMDLKMHHIDVKMA